MCESCGHRLVNRRAENARNLRKRYAVAAQMHDDHVVIVESRACLEHAGQHVGAVIWRKARREVVAGRDGEWRGQANTIASTIAKPIAPAIAAASWIRSNKARIVNYSAT